jgi:hypothetical protein
MEQKATKERILNTLEILLSKIRLHTKDAADVEFRVYEPQVHGQPYMIEISREKFIRRVPVEYHVAQNLKLNQPNPALMREIRTAIMAVRRLAARLR